MAQKRKNADAELGRYLGGVGPMPVGKETVDEKIARLEAQGYGPPAQPQMTLEQAMALGQMSPVERVQARLQRLAETGPQNLESAAMSAMSAAKNIDKIMARQLGLEGQALPVGAAPELTLPQQNVGMAPTVPTAPVAGGTAVPETPTPPRVSAFDRLRDRLKARGLDALYDSIKGLIEADLPEEEFTIQLRQLPAYTQRFAANQKRVDKGLRPLSESQYLMLEDQYQDVMRRYGLPESYYSRGAMGVQPGFEKFLESDVSPVELEDRIQTAQQRVINAAPEIKNAFQQFYAGVTDGDILGYVLNPSKDTLNEIKRKATAAEIGGAARGAGLYAGQTAEEIAALRTRAEQLGQAGVTQAQAQKGFQTVAELAPRGSQLAAIYQQGPYTQTTAEQEVFGLAGSAEAAKQRKKLTQLETAAFSGQTGMGALARDRAGAI